MEIRPIISVVIPTYNSALTIIQAIDSVLNQTFNNLEIIVVDDGSTDNTRNVIDSYITSGSITYLYQENKGCGAARNAGINIAKGEYIALLDADDYWDSNKLAKQLEVFKKNENTIVCYTEAIQVDTYGKIIYPTRNHFNKQRNGNVSFYFAFHNIVTLSSALIKTDSIRRVNGFTETYDLMMVADLDLWLRLAPLGSFRAINEPLTYYRVHNSFSTQNVLKNYELVAKVFKNNIQSASGVTKLWYIIGWLRVEFIKFFYRFGVVRTLRHIGIRGVLKELYRRARLHIEWIYYPAIIKRFAVLHQATYPTNDALFDFVYQRSWGVLVLGQIESEIRSFLSLARDIKPKYMLEIGTANGGNLFLLSNIVHPGGIVMSIDLPGGDFGGGYFSRKQSLFKKFTGTDRSIFLVRGNSHDNESLRKIETVLRKEKLDLLFIDGDHTYEGVKSDFEMYSPLVRSGGIIAFHDIANPPAENYGVKKFWDEIKGSYEHKEIIADQNQSGFGIGVLYMS
jgi:glycosyltransferase involved in cell wall biosynthesis/predicted O-methyltransferase YrrM